MISRGNKKINHQTKLFRTNKILTYRDYGWSEEEVIKIIVSLQERSLIKLMGYNSFTRIHHDDKEIKVVKQMPTIASNKQPTIAIITAQYCEKVAVDAMLENKETFVRYTTVGKSFKYFN